jgi:integrase
MSVQRLILATGEVRYRARVKSHGRGVASRVFARRADAIAWESEQVRRLRLGEWIDPRRGSVPLSVVATSWLETRGSVKRRTRETDAAVWRRYIEPRFGAWPVASITGAEVASWLGGVVASGSAPASARRALATLRLILAHAVDDQRVTRNVAAAVRAPRGGARREGRALTMTEIRALHSACRGPLADVVVVLAFTGLRWGELAGLRVGDQVTVPGRGLRVQRALLASSEGGSLYVDSVKSGRSRTVPLLPDVAAIVDRWAADREAVDWLFHAPGGGPLRETNWKRSVRWVEATAAIGLPTLRVHDLRHTAASIWLGAGADPKVVQRVLGHASAAMTMDLYGHMIDDNLWSAAKKLGDSTGTQSGAVFELRRGDSDGTGR